MILRLLRWTREVWRLSPLSVKLFTLIFVSIGLALSAYGLATLDPWNVGAGLVFATVWLVLGLTGMMQELHELQTLIPSTNRVPFADLFVRWGKSQAAKAEKRRNFQRNFKLPRWVWLIFTAFFVLFTLAERHDEVLAVPFFASLGLLCLWMFVKNHADSDDVSPLLPIILGSVSVISGAAGFYDAGLPPRTEEGVIQRRFIDETEDRAGSHKHKSVRIILDNGEQLTVHSTVLFDYMANPPSIEVQVLKSHYLRQVLEVDAGTAVSDERWDGDNGLLNEARESLIIGAVLTLAGGAYAVWRRLRPPPSPRTMVPA